MKSSSIEAIMVGVVVSLLFFIASKPKDKTIVVSGPQRVRVILGGNIHANTIGQEWTVRAIGADPSNPVFWFEPVGATKVAESDQKIFDEAVKAGGLTVLRPNEAIEQP